MRSQEESKYPDKDRVSPARPFYERPRLVRQARNTFGVAANQQAAQTKLAELIQEHRDLDGAISALFESGTHDPLLIARLKKRKLQLKDEIALSETRSNRCGSGSNATRGDHPSKLEG